MPQNHFKILPEDKQSLKDFKINYSAFKAFYTYSIHHKLCIDYIRHMYKIISNYKKVKKKQAFRLATALQMNQAQKQGLLHLPVGL